MPTPQQVQQLLNQVKEKKDSDRAEVKHKETNEKLDTLNESIKSLDFKQDVSSIVDEIKNIKIEVPEVNVTIPEIKLPDIKVEVPEIKIPEIVIPEIKVPTPQVTVNTPEPTVIINNPDEIKVTEPNWLQKITNPIVEAIKNKVIDKFVLPKTASEAIPVRLSNGKRFYDAISYAIGGAVDTSKIESKEDLLLTELEKKADLTETQPISATSLPLPNGAATSANQTNGNQVTKIKETTPIDTTKFNASTLISYNANDEAVYIDETFDGKTYRTTFTRFDMTVVSTLPISASVEIWVS